MTRFIVAGQWQGSPAARAMLLHGGAEAIAGDLPKARTELLDVPIEAGDAQDTGIRRFSALTRVSAAITEALDRAGDEHALLIGGDCGVATTAIAHAAAKDADLAVVWFDAHADLHSPETSPSGAFAGMALRAVVETSAFPGSGAIAADRALLVGAREFDPAESTFLASGELRALSAEALTHPEEIVDAVRQTGAHRLYIHVDLDVLDPAVMTGVALPVPFGATLEALTATIGALRGAIPLAGASISGFAPARPDDAVHDLGTILRIVGALA